MMKINWRTDAKLRGAMAVAAVVSVFLPTSIVALMPPHITEATPDDGEVLKGDTVEMRGFSLGVLSPMEDLEVVDEDAEEAVVYDLDVDCTWEGPRDGPPGSRNQRCVVQISLEETSPGHTYRIRVLDTTIRVTAAAEDDEAADTDGDDKSGDADADADADDDDG